MNEIISGVGGAYRLEITPRGMGTVSLVKHDEIGHEYYEMVGMMASASGAIRFAEVMASTGDAEQARKASGCWLPI